MLETVGLGRLPVATNLAEAGRGGDAVAFPYGHPTCRVCGTCKRERVRLHRNAGRAVVFVGDGASDRYAAHHADVVFAKDGLAAYCERTGLPFVSVAAARRRRALGPCGPGGRSPARRSRRLRGVGRRAADGAGGLHLRAGSLGRWDERPRHGRRHRHGPRPRDCVDCPRWLPELLVLLGTKKGAFVLELDDDARARDGPRPVLRRDADPAPRLGPGRGRAAWRVPAAPGTARSSGAAPTSARPGRSRARA